MPQNITKGERGGCAAMKIVAAASKKSSPTILRTAGKRDASASVRLTRTLLRWTAKRRLGLPQKSLAGKGAAGSTSARANSLCQAPIREASRGGWGGGPLGGVLDMLLRSRDFGAQDFPPRDFIVPLNKCGERACAGEHAFEEREDFPANRRVMRINQDPGGAVSGIKTACEMNLLDEAQRKGAKINACARSMIAGRDEDIVDVE